MDNFTPKQQEYINTIVNETHNHYELKMQKVFMENKQLRQANTKQQKEIKKLRRIINNKKKRDKQHYKNGKRGTNLNG